MFSLNCLLVPYLAKHSAWVGIQFDWPFTSLIIYKNGNDRTNYCNYYRHCYELVIY